MPSIYLATEPDPAAGSCAELGHLEQRYTLNLEAFAGGSPLRRVPPLGASRLGGRLAHRRREGVVLVSWLLGTREKRRRLSAAPGQ